MARMEGVCGSENLAVASVQLRIRLLASVPSSAHLRLGLRSLALGSGFSQGIGSIGFGVQDLGCGIF